MSEPNAADADRGRTDGRHRRRERGRTAVIDAMVDLTVSTGMLPDVATLAAKAGVSVSSVFRYFDNLDALRADTIARARARYAELFAVPESADGSVDERIAALVGARSTLYTTIAPLSRLVRARAAEKPAFAGVVNQVRDEQVTQVRALFAPELERLDRPQAEDVLYGAVVATSFEAWDLHEALGRSPDQIRRALTVTVAGLLTPP